MKEVFNKEVEKVNYSAPKLDIKIFRKRTNAKTICGLILSYAQQFKKNGDYQHAILFQELYKKARDLEVSETIKFESWRGKGGIKVWATPDKINVEFAGPRDKDEKPNITRKAYTKGEVNRMIVCINNLKEEFDNKIPSRKLGEKYFGGNWDTNVFSKRSDHVHIYLISLIIIKLFIIIVLGLLQFLEMLKKFRKHYKDTVYWCVSGW